MLPAAPVTQTLIAGLLMNKILSNLKEILVSVFSPRLGLICTPYAFCNILQTLLGIRLANLALAEAVEVLRVYLGYALLYHILSTACLTDAALTDVRTTNRSTLEILRIVCTYACVHFILLNRAGGWQLRHCVS